MAMTMMMMVNSQKLVQGPPPSTSVAFWNVADSVKFQSLIQRVSAKFKTVSSDYGNLSESEFRKRGRLVWKPIEFGLSHTR